MKAIGEELLGLFVDDVGFAGPILVWVVLTAVALPRGGLSAIVLFAGLLAILVIGTVRKARK